MHHAQLKEKDQLESSLELVLPENSDEVKFIGLLLMAEILQHEQDLNTVTRYMDSLDFAFLKRMMQIQPHEVPKNAGVNAAEIRAISVDIMSCFALHWQLLTRSEFKDQLPTMLSLLSSTDETRASEKILQIMIKVSSYPQVSMILTNPRYQGIIVDYILDTFDRNDKAHETAISIFKRTFLIIEEGFHTNPTTVLSITKAFLPVIMTKISKRFQRVTETHKSEILRLMTESLIFLPEKYLNQHVKAHQEETTTWTRSIKSGLIQLLSTRQAPSTRDNTFILIGILLKMGPEWLYPELPSLSAINPATSAFNKKKTPSTLVASMETLSLSDEEIDKKFVTLVVHLACVEARVILDELAEDLPNVDCSTKSKGVFSSEEEIKQAKIRKEQVLPVTYEILEVSIHYLVRMETEPELGGLRGRPLFDATTLLKFQDTLVGAYSAILDYLKDLQQSVNYDPASLAKNLLYLASMRVLSSFLIEDASLQTQALPLVEPLEAVVRYCRSKASFKSITPTLEIILDRFHEII
ncbi:hypothetical protein BX616_004631 [Lobosporangium transversale]|uniref:Neurochondrin-domain-containing protein n=1 Tax=Lobosporangium transversale TaxID=64571 RepID=A0A1Y2G6R2_9FUNG|nr:Neurochondrin-domain-containing protein [Lobosporangium transversale]KAF9916098.1 hypothetical protein BX616_004631 [Lobosporangium transversale]ORY98367.1 Neurochondrin-domain-containing protein [Lobosporangium transversale]|eukprot:XP_021875759.1 Neurochondrin-domain-containing protein [Lobosporangium transversale]